MIYWEGLLHISPLTNPYLGVYDVNVIFTGLFHFCLLSCCGKRDPCHVLINSLAYALVCFLECENVFFVKPCYVLCFVSRLRTYNDAEGQAELSLPGCRGDDLCFLCSVYWAAHWGSAWSRTHQGGSGIHIGTPVIMIFSPGIGADLGNNDRIGLCVTCKPTHPSDPVKSVGCFHP